jgi:hypothetical protein
MNPQKAFFHELIHAGILAKANNSQRHESHEHKRKGATNKHSIKNKYPIYSYGYNSKYIKILVNFAFFVFFVSFVDKKGFLT